MKNFLNFFRKEEGVNTSEQELAKGSLELEIHNELIEKENDPIKKTELINEATNIEDRLDEVEKLGFNKEEILKFYKELTPETAAEIIENAINETEVPQNLKTELGEGYTNGVMQWIVEKMPKTKAGRILAALLLLGVATPAFSAEKPLVIGVNEKSSQAAHHELDNVQMSNLYNRMLMKQAASEPGMYEAEKDVAAQIIKRFIIQYGLFDKKITYKEWKEKTGAKVTTEQEKKLLAYL